jgi:hypothetical protein
MTAYLRHFFFFGILLCAGLAAEAQVVVEAPFAKRNIEIPNEGEARLIAAP